MAPIDAHWCVLSNPLGSHFTLRGGSTWVPLSDNKNFQGSKTSGNTGYRPKKVAKSLRTHPQLQIMGKEVSTTAQFMPHCHHRNGTDTEKA
ncbi:hypothetical protein HYALB_00013132 [Hymenoscyphus albidus]|uniref:Uncharacterized protein n=1 Tax=Hymenoscyphus albidus TaxID=595503 RepID=A0A9N9LM59_9HELO|nr:hypothetical protein HYALB_00013132 [Hymenoscyphus albidus]